jgi:hypothetical protein
MPKPISFLILKEAVYRGFMRFSRALGQGRRIIFCLGNKRGAQVNWP